MAKINEQTILDLFIEVERELDQAIEYRRHVGRRMDIALASDPSGDTHMKDYDAINREIDDLRQQRKSVIDLAISHGLDAGKLLQQAAQALKDQPSRRSFSDLDRLIA